LLCLAPRPGLTAKSLKLATFVCVLDAELIEVIDTVKEGRDPKDDKFLALAVGGGASHIVSGDADLSTLLPFRSRLGLCQERVRRSARGPRDTGSGSPMIVALA